MKKQPDVPYPYDKRTNTITLPPATEQEIRQLIQKDDRIGAMKRVGSLTGAGLKVSKNYIDALASKIKR